MALAYRPMTMADYEPALALWKATEGMGLSSADEPAAIERYLLRNPGMSFVAYDEAELAGTVLCGHDGRRGYLHHLAVSAGYRRQGVGRELARCALAALHAEGIEKCHLFVYSKNQLGRAFWCAAGWHERPELVLMSTDV